MQTIDGKDISPLLAGGDEPLREVAVTEFALSKALRWGPWRFVHYPTEMFGSDVGELYNLEKEPLETRNLYHDPGHQDIVHQCRKLLFEWLTLSTRFVTTLPSPEGTEFSAAAEDGKESSKYGPDDRIRRQALNYL